PQDFEVLSFEFVKMMFEVFAVPVNGTLRRLSQIVEGRGFRWPGMLSDVLIEKRCHTVEFNLTNLLEVLLPYLGEEPSRLEDLFHGFLSFFRLRFITIKRYRRFEFLACLIQ